MALPADFNTTRVYGKYVTLDGKIGQGCIKFTPKPYLQLRSASTQTAILPAVFTAVLDAEGSFEIDLPSTDDPDISDVEWQYVVRQDVSGFLRTFVIDVPLGPDIDLTLET